jgi:hypothetical protein
MNVQVFHGKVVCLWLRGFVCILHNFRALGDSSLDKGIDFNGHFSLAPVSWLLLKGTCRKVIRTTLKN